ncbi:epoxyqueuosine reductase [uncultured Methanospirillum sp.]|uniref:epoxyqueuosine reductase n=1 Tax=uncultured Methanospirillum sp. TaxID=262503 RepID=UPI0029C78706|nr:epoxyqueuosine reductase [uncultured Methanospirillum sp.]
MKPEDLHTNPASFLEGSIRKFCRDSPANSLKNQATERAYEEPLVGFSSGGDPLYEEIATDIGPPSLTPAEIFCQAVPGIHVVPEDLTIISWILPQTRATCRDNRSETMYPSERWIRAKHFGRDVSKYLADHLVRTFLDTGISAINPTAVPFFSIQDTKTYGLASTWSDRHAAYVSGLGTFGLCDGLITPVGKAVICGSVIARIRIPPTPRPYTDHHASCLFYAKETCGICMKRCPVGAITPLGHDKELCRNHCFGVAQTYARETYGIDEYACGLCQTGVPCEARNPVRVTDR